MQQLFEFIEHFNGDIMSDLSKRGRGKPKRYEGESSERLSVLVRPRYKNIIEAIAKARQTTTSEAMEYAIAYTARNFILDGKSIYEWSLPFDSLTEMIHRYFEVVLDNKEQCHDNDESYRKLRTDYYSMPDTFKKPSDVYIMDVMNIFYKLQRDWDCKTKGLSQIFNMEKLILALIEEWKSAATPTLAASFLFFFSFLYSNKIISYKDDVKQPSLMRLTVIQAAAILCQGNYTIDGFVNSINAESLESILNDSRIESSVISHTLPPIEEILKKLENH